MPLVLAVLALAGANALDNRFVPALTLPVNLLTAAVLVLLARWDGLVAADLGLSRRTLGRGLRWGGSAAGIVLGIYLLALLTPPGHDAFLDRRADLSVGGGLYGALVRVPFGTVLLEELAFRGVLLSMASRRWGAVRGVVLSSVLFGLWHVLPAAETVRANPALTRLFGNETTGLVTWEVVAVLATTVAGAALCWLRLRSRSLLAPVCLHWATNGFGYLGALLARGLLA